MVVQMPKQTDAAVYLKKGTFIFDPDPRSHLFIWCVVFFFTDLRGELSLRCSLKDTFLPQKSAAFCVLKPLFLCVCVSVVKLLLING